MISCSRRFPLPRRLALAAAGAAALALPVSASAATWHHRAMPRPTATARTHGLTSAGGAVMAWESARVVSPRPGARPAPLRSADVVGATTWPVAGVDTSNYSGTINWPGWYASGVRFAVVKATEGTYYTSPAFGAQYSGSYQAGLIRGAYHFANPRDSDGATQADYFIAHGGGWTGDGKTLPGTLDIEYDPYSSDQCYGLSQSDMVTWIHAFVDRYRARTGRAPIVYTTRPWWRACTGDSQAFSMTSALWQARPASTIGAAPGIWPAAAIWQYGSGSGGYTTGSYDLNRFAGTTGMLAAFARADVAPVASMPGYQMVQLPDARLATAVYQGRRVATATSAQYAAVGSPPAGVPIFRLLAHS